MEEIESSSNTLRKSVTGSLILRINEMLKKPSIEDDLSGVLDKFLQKLSESEAYLANGIFTTNFAEAALLLQSSAALYGKKVDLLWQFILDYQSRIISYEKESEASAREAQILAERQNRYKRKRKIRETLQNTESDNVNKLVNCALEIEKASFAPCGDIHNTWVEGHNKTSLEDNRANKKHIPIIEPPFLINAPIRVGGEVVTTSDKLHMSEVVHEISQEFPDFRVRAFKENLLSISHSYEQDEVIQKFLIHKGVNMLDVDKVLLGECKNYFASYNKQRAAILQNLSLGLLEKRDNICPKRLVTRIPRLSQDVVNHFLKQCPDTSVKRPSSVVSADCIKRSASVAASEGAISGTEDSGFVDADEDNEDEANCTESRTVNEMDDTGFESVLGNASEDFGEELNASSTNIVEGNLDTLESNPERETDTKNLKRNKNVNTPLGELPLNNAATIVPKSVKRKATEDEDSLPKKRRTRVRLKILAVATWFKFECFYTRNYKPEEDEGIVKPIDYESDNDFDNNSDIPDEIDIVSNPEVPELPEVNNPPETTETTKNTTVEAATVQTQTETRPETPVARHENISKQLKEIQESQKRIKEWGSFIGEKLKTQREELDFNIHLYGGNIMETMGINESRKFKDIVCGNSAEEVSRYFLATLQLANTYNIELTNTNNGKLANETMEVKLLTKDRYHEHLEEYLAPSEETFNERLARAQALNPSVPLHSTPFNRKIKKKRVNSEPSPSTSGVNQRRFYNA